MSLLLMKSQLDGTDCSKELTEIFEKFSKEAEELPELEKMLQKELLALDGGEGEILPLILTPSQK